MAIIVAYSFSDVSQSLEQISEVTELHIPSDVTLKQPVSWDGWFKLIWWGLWIYSTYLARLLNPLYPQSFGVAHEYQNL